MDDFVTSDEHWPPWVDPSCDSIGEVVLVHADADALRREAVSLHESRRLALYDSTAERAADRAAGLAEDELSPLETTWWIVRGRAAHCALVLAGGPLGKASDGAKALAARFATASTPAYVLADLASLDEDASMAEILRFDGGGRPRTIWVRDSVDDIRANGRDPDLMDMPPEEHEAFIARLETQLEALASELDPSIRGPYELAESLGVHLPAPWRPAASMDRES